MGEKRVRHSAEFTAKVTLKALKGLQTVNDLAGQYQVHPTQISQWKRLGKGSLNFEGTMQGKGMGTFECID